MKLLRSWPDQVPPGKAHVVDDMERLVIHSHDYRPLAAIKDDVLLIEWDVAVNRRDFSVFAKRALLHPTRILVAPYRIYVGAHAMWAHRRWTGKGGNTPLPGSARPVVTGEPTCELFGLGMAYLPRVVMEAFFDSRYSARAGDVELSMWHHRHHSRSVDIAWNVQPVHLNFPIPKDLT